MNTSLPAVSVSAGQSANLAAECKKPAAHGSALDARQTASTRAHQSGKLHSRLAGYMAFAVAALVALMAAVTVASHDVPLMLGGF